jgi:Fic family protein
MEDLQMDYYEKVRDMWQQFNVNSIESLDLALDNFRILFAYHSGKIENDEIEYHDTREIFEDGKVTGYSGSTRAIFEQQNQKLCYDFLKAKIISREPFSLSLILEIHSILTSGTYDERRYIVNDERPGQFKKHDYVTGKNEVGFPPDEVESGLSEIVDELNNYIGKDILKAASYFHLRFEHIHPFADGNGRVGRTLLNYYLLTHGEPPTIIYNEDKRQYYEALELYDTKEEILPFYDFLKMQTIKTWQKTFERTDINTRQKRKSLDQID